MILQDKINLFLNKAQSKICELALDSAKDLSESYLNSNAITLSIELMDVVEALNDEVLDWTDKEIESIIDYYTWKARLNDIALLVFDDKQQTIIVVDSSTVDNSWVPSFNSLSAEVDANHQYTINEVARLDTRIDNLDFSNLVPQELLDEVDDNSAARHTHNNKTVLDGITQGKVDEIGLNTAHRNTPQIHITNTERNLWNAKVDVATLNAGLATKANTVHQHEISDVNGLTQALIDRNPIPGPAGQDGLQPVLVAGTITDGAYSINIDSTNPQSPILNLVVPKGEDGTDFHIDEYLLSAQRLDSVKYDSVDEGYSILGTDNGVMYYRNPTDDLGNFIPASTSTGWYAVQYAGANGWSPVFAIENVSVSRSVYKLVSWTGGTGTPPAFTNVYVTPYGYSPNEYEAANIQGIPGPTGAAGKVMFPDVAGDTATKANYDSYPKDFVYLDTTLGLIYIKRSDTSGNWSEGYQWKGDTGNQGPAGSDGIPGVESTYTENFTVQLLSGKTFGKYTNGQVVPAIGMTASQLLKDIAIEYLLPSFSSFSSPQINTVEVGTTISTPMSFTFGFNNISNVSPNTLKIIDVTNSNNILIQNQPLTSPISTPIGLMIKTTNGAVNSWKGQATNTKLQLLDSPQFSITWRLKTFYGAIATTFPTDSAGVRGLASSLWDTSNSFSITLNQLKYSIVLRAGKNLVSVVTQNNENITTNFVNSGTINVLLADGVTTQSYTIYNFESATIMNVNATVTLS